MSKHQTIVRVKGDASPELARVVRKWSDNLVRLADDWENDDFPWVYGERALLSVLAGGVWLLNGTAFEEYSAAKRTAIRGKKSAGREDLYFMLGRRAYKAEAQHLWAPATEVHTRSHLRLRDKLKSAVKDASNCSSAGGERLGILFASVTVKKASRATLDGCIKTWLDDVFENVPCTVKAAVFPGAARGCCWWPGDPEAYPGAAVFIKRV
jgi:hypothetical protein